MTRDEQPMIGESPAFLEVLERVSKAAAMNRPILVVGERGTGKELIAERLHYLSPRWDQPLIKLNCAAISDSLLESELFGHEAGAYTDASRSRLGRFEAADGGSLFLDELASTTPAVQEKILRVIEYGQFERLGSSHTRSVDVRLIGAANIDLPELASRGRFRSDLLDRLAFDVITLPPLRARREDILPMAEAFAMRITRELGRELFAGFSPAVVERLLEHDWPGNIRELKNVIERAVYRHEAIEEPVTELALDPFDSPWRPVSGRSTASAGAAIPDPGAAPVDLRAYLKQQEKALAERALAVSAGHQGKAADLLGLSYDQLRGILRKHDLAGR
ncbi:phage shock protein operon transcriptional activator [Wenzhouxiangella limi]|uniref:Phage shock protein operon transcriptional activator n=1 Tax=Wenzhouxiangella limi TaxID=2707351 RepID=A0A845VDU4_9GAMM|nr:phage shock protein operon transcriptional activator [Wenzhouxiangella limi]NDY95429.1 phage shock protein operon transcriptional activator [Wenzhouxiangella limi]